MTRNIAIVGRFCSGKTTVANQLVQHFNFTHVSFAGRLKQVASSVYGGGQPLDKAAVYLVTHEAGFERPLSGRQLLQQLGQSVKSFDRDLWIRWLKADIEQGTYGRGPYVLDDARFPYEAKFLQDELGFVIARLDTHDEVRMARYERLYGRLPTDAEMNHPSEIEVDQITPDLVMPGDIQAAEIARLIVGSV